MSNKQVAVVLLSGGQDSTTCLFWARDQWPGVELHALSVDYGQRHISELDMAGAIAYLAGCASHVQLDLAALMAGGSSDLLLENSDRGISADGGMRDAEAPTGLPTSFVPGRNLMLLAAATARAGAVGAQHIVTGVCQTDYSGYPDCRQAFVDSMQVAVDRAWPSDELSPHIYTPLMDLTKAQTVTMMRDLAQREMACDDSSSFWLEAKAWKALALSRTCYLGSQCGSCPACTIRARGFAEAGIADPAIA